MAPDIEAIICATGLRVVFWNSGICTRVRYIITANIKIRTRNICKIKGLERRRMRAQSPKKDLCLFLYQDWIFWPNVTNITNDDFMPHHFVFYVFFYLLSEKNPKMAKNRVLEKKPVFGNFWIFLLNKSKNHSKHKMMGHKIVTSYISNISPKYSV